MHACTGNTTGWQTMQTDYANIIKSNVGVPLGSQATSIAIVGTIASAFALWVLWKKQRKEQIQDDT